MRYVKHNEVGEVAPAAAPRGETSSDAIGCRLPRFPTRALPCRPASRAAALSTPRGRMAGSVVFAGYGITAPEYSYDDYAGLDVKGKVVLVLRHEPQESDPKSVFEGKTLTQHAQFAAKALNDKLHGAAGVILVTDRANHPGAADELEKFGVTAGPTDARIPFVQVTEARVDKWFADAGKSLDKIQGDIDKALKPQSFAFPDTIRVEANLDVERAVK